MTYRFRRTPVFANLMVLVAGCSSAIEGNWTAPDAPGAISSLYITQAEFKPNGDFVAVGRTGEGGDVTLRGKYEFDGVSLRLMQPRKPDLLYRAAYNAFTKNLSLQKGDDRQTLRKM